MTILKLFERFGRVTWELLLSPGRFFSRMPLNGGVKLPLLYAVMIHWMAAAASFGWEEAIIRTLKRKAEELFLLFNDAQELGSSGRNFNAASEALGQMKDQFLTWFWGASAVLLSPFKTLGLLLWATFVLFVASRLLIFPDPLRPVSVRGSFRIACFASTAVLWKVIPVAGSLVAEIMVLFTTVIAVRKAYNISQLRALAIALFPQILFLVIIFLGIGSLMWLIARAFQ